MAKVAEPVSPTSITLTTSREEMIDESSSDITESLDDGGMATTTSSTISSQHQEISVVQDFPTDGIYFVVDDAISATSFTDDLDIHRGSIRSDVRRDGTIDSFYRRELLTDDMGYIHEVLMKLRRNDGNCSSDSDDASNFESIVQDATFPSDINDPPDEFTTKSESKE